VITRLNDIITLFPGFEIPYLATKPNDAMNIEDLLYEQTLIREEEIPRENNDVEPYENEI
jgi:hypothetical protein